MKPHGTIRVVHGDITTFTGDVIVNAAKPSLLGGGGVDGRIHQVAGPELSEACRSVKVVVTVDGRAVRCPTGHVVPTPAFDLPCSWVFHTVGPIWPVVENASNPYRDPVPEEVEAGRVLQSCFDKPARLAAVMDLRSIAFPAISTGVYGCPVNACAGIALQWARHVLRVGVPLDMTFYVYAAEDMPLWATMAANLELDI